MIEGQRKVLVKKFITSYPILFGVLLVLLLFGALVAEEAWFPQVGQTWARHNRLAQAVLFTAVYFALYFYGLRRWRRQTAFWPTIFILLLLHVLGILFYSTQVHPIGVWQWPIVGLLEYYSAAFFLEWTGRRFGYHPEHQHPLRNSER